MQFFDPGDRELFWRRVNDMEATTSLEYGFVAPVDLPFDDAITRLEASLKEEGFGVLCQIDIKAKLQEKLGVEFTYQ